MQFKVFILLIFTSICYAKTDKDLASILKHYNSSPAVNMKTKKRITITLTERTSESEGVLSLSQGRFRLEIDKPEPLLVVWDGQIIWQEQKLPQEFGGKIQVSKMHIKKKDNLNNTVLALLFGNKQALKNAKVLNKNKNDGKIEMELKPLKQSEIADIEKIRLKFSKKEIYEMTYWDSTENQITFEFSNIEFLAKANETNFKYVPPKGAEVTEL